MIHTNEVKMTSKNLFTISLRNLGKPWFIAFIIIFLLICFSNLKNYTAVEILVNFASVVFCIILILAVLLYNAYSKKNKSFYRERTYQIDDKFIAYTMLDGSEGKMNFDTFIKIIKRPQYYLLYISNSQFIYIPVTCFKSEKDRQEFEQILEKHKLIVK